MPSRGRLTLVIAIAALINALILLAWVSDFSRSDQPAFWQDLMGTLPLVYIYSVVFTGIGLMALLIMSVPLFFL